MFPPRKWLGLAVTTVVIAALCIPLEWLTHDVVTWFPQKLNALVNAAVVGGVAVLLYPLLLMVTKVYTKQDTADLPAPIQKLLRKLGRMAGKGARG
ncbi:hypothetical protein D3C73_1521410 [compost metagenome]